MTQPSDNDYQRHDGSGVDNTYTPGVGHADNVDTEDFARDPLTTQDSYFANPNAASGDATFEADIYGSESSDTGPSGKSDAAKRQAGEMKDSAKESGQKVAGTAKEQATQVKNEAGQQAKGMLQSGISEASGQLGQQQKRLAGSLQSVVDELGSMAANSEQSGPMTDLAQQAADKGSQLAQRLQHSEPSELLDDVRAFARQRPVAFLGIAALTGLVVGRLTRGMAADAKSDSGTSRADYSHQGSAEHGYPDAGSRFQGQGFQGQDLRGLDQGGIDYTDSARGGVL